MIISNEILWWVYAVLVGIGSFTLWPYRESQGLLGFVSSVLIGPIVETAIIIFAIPVIYSKRMEILAQRKKVKHLLHDLDKKSQLRKEVGGLTIIK